MHSVAVIILLQMTAEMHKHHKLPLTHSYKFI